MFRWITSLIQIGGGGTKITIRIGEEKSNAIK